MPEASDRVIGRNLAPADFFKQFPNRISVQAATKHSAIQHSAESGFKISILRLSVLDNWRGHPAKTVASENNHDHCGGALHFLHGFVRCYDIGLFPAQISQLQMTS
jgi:hypothetical protein